ncbi:acyl-CoA dehydrogenase family protein [Myxococcota bacterium]|nr:acyl-CoA dehydrogenase family protein [Myxococcota bacterium]
MGNGLEAEALDIVLTSLREVAKTHLTDRALIELDHRDEFPEELVRSVFGRELGVQLLFIPEELGGMGGGAFDIYRVSEAIAHIDLGIATGVLATFLGSEPINVGGTPEQKTRWIKRIADEGVLFAYGATEPGAGSDLGALKTTARRVEKDGKIEGYVIDGSKQWISNGGVADLYTILANAPEGPTWFVVDKGTKGFSAGKPEDKHGIRASNTAPLSLDEVYVEADRLVGGVEGQGLTQAQSVFGYTRLMVAAFGLGGGWAALDRAIPYSVKRVQGGSPLHQKQGYTHKLIVPHVVRLEAARAHIEETAERLDRGEDNLNTEGAISKYQATEAGNAAAEAAIQALGGYGYVKEYLVEKVKRDVRITTIYEGTSEILEMTIARDRWQLHLKSRGAHYEDAAKKLDAIHRDVPDVGANVAALGLRALAVLLERARTNKLTRHQHVLFRIGELVAWAECGEALVRRAARMKKGELSPKTDHRFDAPALAAMSRVYARMTALKLVEDGLTWILGAADDVPGDLAALEKALGMDAIRRAQTGLVADMDRVRDAIYANAS